MKKISYYNGKEAKHPTGFGVAPGNIYCIKKDIKEKLQSYQIKEGTYLFNGTLIEFFNSEDFSGGLELELIAETEKILKIATKKLNIPFDPRVILDYFPDDILFEN